MGQKMRHFTPSPDIAYNHTLHAWWENGFSNDEIKEICKMGEKLPKMVSQVGMNEGTVSKQMRDSTNSWINSEGWIADKLENIARNLNGHFFGLDLWGFAESFQYTVYKYKKNQEAHYTWHMDCGPGNGSPRKLSMVLQLSDPSEYEGGDLELFTSANPIITKKQKGIIHAFPSYVMHRVTPVTKGVRKTLVVWIAGPRFK
jgi:PKHD-type hydroxylase